MHRSKLKNLYHKFPTKANEKSYKKYRNFCVSLLRKEKKKYYNNLDLKDIANNKKFWQSVKPLFTGKSKLQTNITIVENKEVVTEKNEVAEILNNYFIEAVQKLDIEKFTYEGKHESHSENIDDLIDKIISKYKLHPSILKIKEHIEVKNKFKFEDTTEDEIFLKIKSLDPKKACMQNDIPAKTLIGTNDIISNHLSKIYNS